MGTLPGWNKAQGPTVLNERSKRRHVPKFAGHVRSIRNKIQCSLLCWHKLHPEYENYLTSEKRYKLPSEH